MLPIGLAVVTMWLCRLITATSGWRVAQNIVKTDHPSPTSTSFLETGALFVRQGHHPRPLPLYLTRDQEHGLAVVAHLAGFDDTPVMLYEEDRHGHGKIS
ncbi:hypothetical protein LA080_012992 [Diaporthe eres]|nr:hypothetical protein LA080_012992 [Diaporthe eres]